MVEWLGLIIACGAFLVGATSLGWQIVSHRQSKTEKAEAHLSEELDVSRRWSLLVTVVNTGDPPLHIRMVELVFKHRERAKVPSGGKKAIALADTLPFKPRKGETGPLAPGQERVYVYPLQPIWDFCAAYSPGHWSRHTFPSRRLLGKCVGSPTTMYFRS